MNDYPRPITRFVILNAPRTGSNMLCTVLNSHPQVLCHHEIFNPNVVGYARHLQETDFSIGTMQERERDPIEFLGRVWRAPLGHPCVGFKLCWRQNETIFCELLRDQQTKKIVLKRKNRVRSFISLLLARKTGKWVVYGQPGQPEEKARVEVKADELFETIAFNDAYYAEIEETLRLSNQTYWRLDYEDLFTGEARAGVLRFLGVSPLEAASLKEETIKLNPYGLEELVCNFAELQAALRGTALEADLYSA